MITVMKRSQYVSPYMKDYTEDARLDTPFRPRQIRVGVLTKLYEIELMQGI